MKDIKVFTPGKSQLVLIFIVVALLTLSFSYSFIEKEREEQPVQISDKNFEAVIRKAVNKPYSKIIIKDLKDITELDASNANIKDLDGIEHMINLYTLDLSCNNITDISKLSALKNLRVVDLEDNNIKDISAFKSLKNVERLNLKNNLIVDISAIGSLNSLKRLNLQGNRITDIDILTNLKSLKNLDLQNNRISDFTVLNNLKSLSEKLYLSGNYSDDYSVLKPIYNNINNKDFYTESFKGIPQVHIDTKGVDIYSTTERIEGHMTIKNSEGSNYPEEGLYKGKIGIRGRGNSSWGGADKKPYNIELWDDTGNSIDAPILDLPEEEDWLLIPNYFDKSLMRNFIALDTARKIGMPYIPKTRYVEVYLNGSYEGNYLLVERIKRDKNRLGIKSLTHDERDQSGIRLTGGYILQIDWVKDSDYFRSDISRQDIILTYPRPENMTAIQKLYITQHVKKIEEVLYSDNFKDPEIGYRKYIDVDSFVNYFIIHELAKNVDAWRLSTFLYKDRDEKLAIGPVWDFDIAFGNVNYMDGWKTIGLNPNFPEHRSWYSRLMQDQYFMNKVRDRWTEVKPIIETIPDTIDQTAEMIKESADRNFARWPILGIYVWPNKEPFPETYDGEVENLKNWISSRIEWMDLKYGS